MRRLINGSNSNHLPTNNPPWPPPLLQENSHKICHSKPGICSNSVSIQTSFSAVFCAWSHDLQNFHAPATHPLYGTHIGPPSLALKDGIDTFLRSMTPDHTISVQVCENSINVFLRFLFCGAASGRVRTNLDLHGQTAPAAASPPQTSWHDLCCCLYPSFGGLRDFCMDLNRSLLLFLLWCAREIQSLTVWLISLILITPPWNSRWPSINPPWTKTLLPTTSVTFVSGRSGPERTQLGSIDAHLASSFLTDCVLRIRTPPNAESRDGPISRLRLTLLLFLSNSGILTIASPALPAGPDSLIATAVCLAAPGH